MPAMRSPAIVSTKYGGESTDGDSRSAVSYKSTQSSRSSVLERAREYNRRIDEENRKRAKSADRMSDSSSKTPGTPRSISAGRSNTRMSTRERAMASVRHDTANANNSLSQQYGGRERTPRSTPQSHMSSKSQNNAIIRRPEPTTPQSLSRSEKMTQRSTPKSSKLANTRAKKEEEPHEAVVTPELLVDALSGHEDGLLAIAERLMEHYDKGYDVMGEAIIDAFADVQKLFQHVVEAAHMEGAAFEASRREQEMAELRKQVKGGVAEDALAVPATPSGMPSRHDEFIDQDVKDLLTEAIRKGATLREGDKHTECYKLYEAACNSASSLLPVDSDHRGRLQLSIARAESMSADRACAILRYAMDDVLRSGLRAGKNQLPDPSKRGDCVLSKPKEHPSLNGSLAQSGVVQSSEEALASLVEEMKEVLGAPVYDNTPLQTVADRFWIALGDAQRSQLKNEERLEQSLGKLKGEFLLARAEWEEKLTQSQEHADYFKRRYMSSKDTMKGEQYLEQARSAASKWTNESREGDDDFMGGYEGSKTRPSNTGSVASLGSGLAQQARTLVGSFSCAGMNERSGVLQAELSENGRGDTIPYRVPKNDRMRMRTRTFSNQSGSSGTTPTRLPQKSRRGRSNTRRDAYHYSTADV